MNSENQFNNYINKDKLNLEKIVKEFTPYVKTIVNNTVSDKLSYEDKEEIITDTFFILWKNQDKIQSSLKAYIAGIVKNLIKEKLNKKKILYNLEEYENIIEMSSTNLFLSERTEIEKIEKSLNKLKKIDFEIITMFYYSSSSIKEISQKLDISEMNVKTRLFRIRKKIKKELGVGD